MLQCVSKDVMMKHVINCMEQIMEDAARQTEKVSVITTVFFGAT